MPRRARSIPRNSMRTDGRSVVVSKPPNYRMQTPAGGTPTHRSEHWRSPAAPDAERWADVEGGHGAVRREGASLIRFKPRLLGFVLLILVTASGGRGRQLSAATKISRTNPR